MTIRRDYTGRPYHARVELLASNDGHLRYVPRALAEQMVKAGTGEVGNANGKVRSIRLIASASTHAARIGEATVPMGPASVRFVRREWLEESGTRIWQHHPRCHDYEFSR